MSMHIVIIGSGAREHALATVLEWSPRAAQNSLPTTPVHNRIHCLGTSVNPGIKVICQRTGGVHMVGDITDSHSVLAFCISVQASLVVIGPEAPLEAGVTDLLRDKGGLAVFGPDRQNARIETSKAFARAFLNGILSEACPAYMVATSMEQAERFLELLGDHFVIKADGLTGGKGVKVSQDHLNGRDEALAYCRELLRTPGSRCVIEEKLYGEEFSLMTVTDGTTCIHFPAVQDHKRAYNGDIGPNTGGMGSYSCADHGLPFLTDSDIATAQRYNGMVASTLSQKNGRPYRGVLYGGFMATGTGIKIIEYNARFGDPEALNLLSLLESDAVDLFLRTARGTLAQGMVRFASKASVCKYVVPMDYPQPGGEKGSLVTIGTLDNTIQLYMGSIGERADGKLVTGGSRTLALVALADTLSAAEQMVEANIIRIHGNLRHRSDIGTADLIDQRIRHMHCLRTTLRLGILGSTRGTDMQYLIDAIDGGTLSARIVLVVSDRQHAGILDKAAAHGIHWIYSSPKGLSREAYDDQTSKALQRAHVDLVLLIGYMRILSPGFCHQWSGRAINVHPSLLPDFAGGMDGDIHEAVITRMRSTGEDITGCSVHLVTQDVDKGDILVQKQCKVFPDDTPETLKKRVQALEGEALMEAITGFQRAIADRRTI